MPDWRTYFPPIGGFRFGMFTIPPSTVADVPADIPETAFADLESALPGMMRYVDPSDPGMHTTDTIDFEVVLDGSVVLELVDGAEVTPHPRRQRRTERHPPSLAQRRRHPRTPGTVRLRRIPRRGARGLTRPHRLMSVGVPTIAAMGAKRHRNNSSNTSGAGFALLVLIALIIKFIWWILGALALVLVFFVVRAIVRENRKRRAAYAQYCGKVAARADQQHNWVLQGDDRGIYGTEGARLMHDIRGRDAS